MTVSVGFAPATTPGVITGGTTAAAGEADAPEGLFAAILAMVTPAVEAEIPEAIGSTDFAALVQKAIPTLADGDEETEPADVVAAPETTPLAELPKTPEGKALLKDLGDALIAINDALEAGTPVDPALEKKLGEAVDAIAAWLGVAITPPAPAIDPRISALASGEGVLPAAAPTDLPPAAPVVDPGIAPEQAPIDATVEPVLPAIAPGDEGAEPGATTPVAAAPIDDAPKATTIEEAPAALRELGLLIGKLSQRLEPQDPVLAKKLAALAEGLQSGTASADLMAALDIDDASTDADLTRIVDALSSTRPTGRPVDSPQLFTGPALVLPEPLVRPKGAESSTATDATTSTATPKLEAAPVEVAKAAPTPVAARDSKPEDRPAPAPIGATAPATTDPTAQPNAPTSAAQQPAAAPVARTIHAAYQAPLQQVNLPQVAFEVVRQFDAGNSRFQIRLDPPELGRIDVRLEVDKSGTVNARMTVERPETLDLMQRDQRALQQALQQAGLDAARTNLEFSLRQNPFAGQGNMGEGGGQQPAFGGGGLSASDDAVATEAATTLYRGTASAGGVNLFV